MSTDPPAPRGRVADRGHRRLAIHDAATLGHDQFVAHFGGVFEDSPWIADAAWRRGPFDSVETLHAELCAVVREAAPEARVALIRAHPELAGRAAIAGELTPESAGEQASAGLDRLTPEQHRDLLALTAAYRERFGFPYVVCVREHGGVDSILANARARLDQDAGVEEATALDEIAKIAALRLADLVEDGRTSG
jgi:2-oxo-4-hydroxy-4-carboxy-5-ureidoimidazoline decarboxylase